MLIFLSSRLFSVRRRSRSAIRKTLLYLECLRRLFCLQTQSQAFLRASFLAHIYRIFKTSVLYASLSAIARKLHLSVSESTSCGRISQRISSLLKAWTISDWRTRFWRRAPGPIRWINLFDIWTRACRSTDTVRHRGCFGIYSIYEDPIEPSQRFLVFCELKTESRVSFRDNVKGRINFLFWTSATHLE